MGNQSSKIEDSWMIPVTAEILVNNQFNIYCKFTMFALGPQISSLILNCWIFRLLLFSIIRKGTLRVALGAVWVRSWPSTRPGTSLCRRPPGLGWGEVSSSKPTECNCHLLYYELTILKLSSVTYASWTE